ncbi:serine hydrolase [Cytobacillus depressus]|uniref:Serine hydrolase n=1 Tax=Cytobacillus depressus TaxID=1602942 RepID=A0A6L3V1X5_9BACI|nr:serine hydrolase [Cytobacillus depressus]KAB2329933.1 serine hydrolase [Cytobacillus depressus]
MKFLSLKAKVEEVAAKCQGRVGLVVETSEGRLEIRHHEKFSSASLIKIPILIEGLRQYDHGLLHLQEYVPASPSSRVGGAGVIQTLSDDLQLKVVDLMALMIIVSDNTATNLLIDRLGKDKINQCIQALYLQSTELNRKMMDFVAIRNGRNNYTSPEDMITCLKVIDNQPQFLSGASSVKALTILENQQFKNKLSYLMDLDHIRVANKTGELPGVEHDCAIIKYGGKTIYAAVLIDQLSKQEDGHKTLAQIGKLVSQYIMTN